MKVADDDHRCFPILHKIDRFVHADKILEYFVKERITGKRFYDDFYLRKFKLSWLSMGKWAVMKLQKEKHYRPIIAGKDFRVWSHIFRNPLFLWGELIRINNQTKLREDWISRRKGVWESLFRMSIFWEFSKPGLALPGELNSLLMGLIIRIFTTLNLLDEKINRGFIVFFVSIIIKQSFDVLLRIWISFHKKQGQGSNDRVVSIFELFLSVRTLETNPG